MSPAGRRSEASGSERDDYLRTALAWADHLCGGGTTPWPEFCSTPRSGGARIRTAPARGAATPDDLPPAAQLELVRRLAVHARRSSAATAGSGFDALADLVLTRPAPGRGASDRPLTWPGDASVPAGRRGAPPVDPGSLPADELLRLGAGLVADLLAASESQPAPAPPRSAGSRLVAWSRARRGPAYRVVGAASRAAEVRATLAEAGHPEGGRLTDAVVLVVVDSVDSMLTDAWRMRVERGSRTRWRTFVGAWAARDRLPPSAALDELAAAYARRVAPERVHVVADGSLEGVAGVLGLRVAAVPAIRSGQALSPVATDVVRRVNAVLQGRFRPEERAALVARLLALVAERAPGPGALRVPARHRHWAATAGCRLARRLAAGDYPVHGDLAVLRRPAAGPPGPRAHAVLETMLDAVLALGGVVPPGPPQGQGGRR